MPIDRTQVQRFEIKYLITEQIARTVRSHIRAYMKPDDYAVTLPNFSYPVHTLYLDSPDLATYRAVKSGDRNRFKLRIRFYDDSPEGPAYFEVKRRVNACIVKQRARVRRASVHALLQGEPPHARHLVEPHPKQLAALQEFCRLMRVLQATPRSHVAYMREAWMSPVNNALRITFDRQVQCEAEFKPRLTTQVGDAVSAFRDQVILELKFIDRLPHWCADMVRCFGLRRSGAPKYVAGVSLLGEDRLARAAAEGNTAAKPNPHPGRPDRSSTVVLPGLLARA
jgi:hypothetical protein